MFHVEADKPFRLLKVIFSQHVGPEELRAGFEQVQILLADMPPRFRLLVDLSGLESMDISSAAEIGKAMDLFDAKGVATVVRVLPDPRKDIGLNILSLFHYGPNVQIVTCRNLEEAHRILSA